MSNKILKKIQKLINIIKSKNIKNNFKICLKIGGLSNVKRKQKVITTIKLQRL